ncbi:Bax inhibitor-1/YccA family membrane protein [Branchiibius cervicis]|uniref:Bax inhibitor-1/YccA family protein n=1 Tax=Branchiibius cervicis TaxID=908252 RepID=A0ABW2AV30_9MICO
MASNPVFDRFDKDLSKGEYASIGQPQYGQYAQPQQPGMPGGQWSQAPAAGAAAYQQNLEDLYNSPSATAAQTRRMTMNDVVMKSLGLFAVLVAFGAAAWFLCDRNPSLTVPFWIGGAVLGLILVFVISFKKVVSPPLIVAYAAVEGVFLGAISRTFEHAFPGVVIQAVIATLCVFVGMYALFFTGVIKVTERSRKIFMMALLGYVLFAVVNAILVWTGVLSGWGVGNNSGWGILISVFAVGLAAYSLAVDFDTIQRGVQAGLPEKYSWLMAFGLMVTVVWLYVELLRLFARMRDN